MNPDIDLDKDPPAPTPNPSPQHLGDTVPLKRTRATRSLNVFLVEDEEFIRERVIEKIAASRAKIVDHADSAAAAIMKLRELRCDVIILDLLLKQGTGFQVLREIRGHGDSRPWIIVFTNFNDPHFRKQAMVLGADFFVDKAQGLDGLGEIIEGLPVPNGGGSI
jgi:DNA-binding NarL/FixJ family response regulator